MGSLSYEKMMKKDYDGEV